MHKVNFLINTLIKANIYLSYTVIVLLCFKCCFYTVLLLGLKKMVDFITNRNFEAYQQFAPSTNNRNETLASLTTLKRYSQDQVYQKKLTREADINVRDRQLLHIKEAVPEVHVTSRRPFMGLCCQNCTFTSRESLVKKTTETLALFNILNQTAPLNKNGVLARTFNHLHQISRLKRYQYPQVARLVLKDDRVKKAVEKAALQQFKDASDEAEDEFYQELIKKNWRRAGKLIYDMRSTLSDFLLRFTSWILYKLLPCFLSSVVVHPGQIEMIKEASKSNLPLIFLPLHRSHLDYILLSFILLNNDIRSPLVAAGDNLRIPFFGSLLRGLGAFFIKRRIDPVMGRKDYVYKAVLHTYMNLCLRAGHNMEFFLEGGRTRTGKPLMPKYGILSVIVDTFMDGTIEDALLVPVSVNYEKLVDGNFVREQLGEAKKMETFRDALKGIWHVLNSNYGMMRVDFNQPFSLRELIKTFDQHKASTTKPNSIHRILKSNPSTNSLYGTDVVSEEHKSLVENISKHVLYDCARSTTVMSTNALAFLLLTKYRNGVSLEKLVVSFEELKKDLEFTMRDVGFSGDPVDVINYAVDLLGPALVKKEKDIIKPIAILPNVIELSYYSNTVVTHYALESVIALALNASEIRLDTVSHEDLMENALELCSILQYEFLFCKPCQNLEQVITERIEDLVLRREIFLSDFSNDLMAKSRKMAAQFDDEEDENPTFQKLYRINTSREAKGCVEYLKTILMPLMETYAVTGFTLDKLVQRQLLENELVGDVLKEMKSQVERGSLKYDESVAVDPIKNALKYYQKLGVLECHQENKLRLYYLKESYDNSDSVKVFYDKINRFRIGNSLFE
ncbi:glycerol-3-phosphate acyltransferase 1, mitochondrial isoform X1 [Anthonomus grandis grandis]|uniref:glycerol-3-phosphate acyltransferase 1, mitochondrial isoform X1 n=1 Tax=Anthonomus grandis grandis TaxID=2921223 RepID=UPI002166B12E|nr:glycerol-3-phosphate acyltransferase 1, mitochondrial isoform X1 [Anthonomus grandis grandis]